MGRFSLRATNDEEYKRFSDILFHPDICNVLITDIPRALINFNLLKKDTFYACILKNDNEDIGIAGVLLFPKIKKGMVDIGFLKEFRGKEAFRAAKEALQEFIEKYNDFELLCTINNDNRPSLFFVRKLGWEYIKKCKKKSILRYEK